METLPFVQVVNHETYIANTLAVNHMKSGDRDTPSKMMPLDRKITKQKIMKGNKDDPTNAWEYWRKLMMNMITIRSIKE